METKTWLMAIAGCAVGVLYLLSALFGDSFAPQLRTELALLAIAFAVVPYVLVQSVLRLLGERP